MPNPTLVWSNTTPRAISIAGANATIPELLTALKAAIDTDSVHWMTSDYSAPNGTLEIKRKGTPTGEQSTVRILFFGGAFPNGAALGTGIAQSASNLYSSMSVTAATAGPSTSYAADAPYAVTYIPGRIVASNAAISASETPLVSLVECEDALCVWFGDINTWCTSIVGRLIEDAAASSLMWCVMTPGPTNNINRTAPPTGTEGNSPVPPLAYYDAPVRGAMWNSTLGALRAFGRAIDISTGSLAGANPLGSTGLPTALIPVPLCTSLPAAGTAINYLGSLRQIRLGPVAQHLHTLRNAAGVVQAIHFGPPLGLTGYGAWFDQVA